MSDELTEALHTVNSVGKVDYQDCKPNKEIEEAELVHVDDQSRFRQDVVELRITFKEKARIQRPELVPASFFSVFTKLLLRSESLIG